MILLRAVFKARNAGRTQSILVENADERSKPVLSGDVPELDADGLAVEGERFQGEVHGNGGLVVLGKLAIDVPLDDRGLADGLVADDQEFGLVEGAAFRFSGAD